MNFKFNELHESIFKSNKQLNILKAVAGSGKTSTMLELAKRNPSKKYIYLTYNKSASSDIKSKATSNVFASTFHSIAARKYLHLYSKKIKPSITVKDILDTINLKISKDNVLIAKKVIETINKFQNSDCLKIRDVVGRVNNVSRDTIIMYSEIVWECMVGVDFSMPCTHDTYLKLFHINKDIIESFNIILDEAQDATNVMIEILVNQMLINDSNLFIVGDENQSIYNFRHSSDAMKTFENLRFDKSVFNLNNSYRFGDNISMVSNKILEMKGVKTRIVGLGGKDIIVKKIGSGKKVAIISRKNETILDMAIKTLNAGKTMFFIGGFESYSISGLPDIENLYLNNRKKIINIDMLNYKTFAEFESMAYSVGDSTTIGLCEIVKKYSGRVTSKINEIKSMIVKNSYEADVVLTNVHKSKGLEFDNVYICNDFKAHHNKDGFRLTVNDIDYENEELNLLYVAVTRAKKRLKINKSIEMIIKNI